MPWRVQVGNVVGGPPLVVDGVVVVPCGDNWIYAFDAASGRLRWKHLRRTTRPIDFWPPHRIAAAGRLVFVGEPDAPSAVRAIQAATGATLWHHELGYNATVLGLTAADGVVVAECGGEIRCLEATDGRERWRFAISDLPRFRWAASIVAGDAVVCAGSVIAPAGQDIGVVACLGLGDGVLRWDRSISDHGFRFAARNEVVYGGTAGGKLFAFEVGTDQQLWGKSFPWRQTDPPAVASVAMTTPIATDEWLYVGCGNGYTYRIDPADGKPIWRWDAPLRVEAITHTSGVIFAGFFDGSVAAYPDHSGDFLWWQRGPIGRIQGLTYANGMLYVSGKRHLAAFQATDGRPPWQWRLSTSRSVRAPARSGSDAH